MHKFLQHCRAYVKKLRCLKIIEHPRATQGATDAKLIRLELERLSDFKFKPTHPSVEDFNIAKPEHKEGEIEPLDYDSYSAQGNLIAHADFTGSNYQLLNPNAPHYSRIMPVSEYKGRFIKQALKPCYIVFWMKREPSAMSEACVWIKGKDVIKCRTEWLKDKMGKWQLNYMTNKEDWHRGLLSFIKELKRKAVTLWRRCYAALSLTHHI